jgi:hypothetical protein
MARHLECLLAVAGRRGGPVDTVVDDGVRVGRAAGSAAANQYGTFAVHAASPAQVRYLASLLETRVAPEGMKVPTTLDGISKKSASALIDKLVDRPRKGAAAAAQGNPASEKQVALITKLFSEKDWAGVIAGIEIDTNKAVPANLTGGRGGSASAVIDALFQAPRRTAQTASPARSAVEVTEADAGAYRLADGRIARIYYGQQSGAMQCAALVDITAEERDDAWDYLGRAHRFFAGATKLTVEECEALAAAGGADHGWCCVCGRRLDDPNSVARSIGPVCRAKQGL